MFSKNFGLHREYDVYIFFLIFRTPELETNASLASNASEKVYGRSYSGAMLQPLICDHGSTNDVIHSDLRTSHQHSEIRSLSVATKRVMKLSIVILYQRCIALENFVGLNQIGFNKICKKFDKNTRNSFEIFTIYLALLFFSYKLIILLMWF